MPTIKTVSIFGSSAATPESYEGKIAAHLARFFCNKEITIVHGAFDGGIMKIIDDTLCESPDRKVMGIVRGRTSRVSQNLLESARVYCDDIDPATYPRTMGRRLGILADSDAFVINLGPTSGSGTATELCAVVDYNINKHGPDGCYRPVVILHPDNSYNNVEFQLIAAFGQKGLDERRRNFNQWMHENGHDSWLKVIPATGQASIDARQAVKFILGE